MSPATPVVHRVLLLGVAALLAEACGPGHGKVAQIADRDGKPVATRRPDADVSVLDPGAEPRAPLRYRIDPGQSESLVMDVALRMNLTEGDRETPIPFPTVRLDMEVRSGAGVERVQLDGKITRVQVLEDPGIPATWAAAVRGDLASMTGLAWKATFTDRGHLDLLSLPAPKDSNTQLLTTLEWVREGLRLLLPPLPETPVGKDARWQTRRRSIIATAKIDETVIYKLAGNGQPQLAVTLGMDALEQALTPPGSPPGTSWKLTSFEGGGKGQIDLHLTSIVQPTNLRWAASGKGTATTAADPPRSFTMGLDAALTVKRR